MNNRNVFLIIPEAGEVQAQAASRLRPESFSTLLAGTFSLRPHTMEGWDGLPKGSTHPGLTLEL